jgi:hypothetical protein
MSKGNYGRGNIHFENTSVSGTKNQTFSGFETADDRNRVILDDIILT